MLGIPSKEIAQASVQLTLTLQKADLVLADVQRLAQSLTGIAQDLHMLTQFLREALEKKP